MTSRCPTCGQKRDLPVPEGMVRIEGFPDQGERVFVKADLRLPSNLRGQEHLFFDDKGFYRYVGTSNLEAPVLQKRCGTPFVAQTDQGYNPGMWRWPEGFWPKGDS